MASRGLPLLAVTLHRFLLGTFIEDSVVYGVESLFQSDAYEGSPASTKHTSRRKNLARFGLRVGGRPAGPCEAQAFLRRRQPRVDDPLAEMPGAPNTCRMSIFV